MTQTGTTSHARFGPLAGMLTAALAGVSIGIALTASAPVSGIADSGEVVSVGLPIARALLNVAAVTTVGLGLLAVLIGHDRRKHSESVLALARPAAVAAALAWAVSALVTLVLQTAEYRPGTGSVTVGDIAEYVGAVDAGKALLIVAGLALAQVLLGLLATRNAEKVPAELRVGLGLLTLLPLPVTGHAADRGFHDLTMVSIELHVMSVVVWTGGLGAMAVLLLGNRVLLARALPRFSRLATLCLVVSAATGLFNGALEIALTPGTDLWTGLFQTSYGQLMLLKVAATAAIAVLGGYTRWWLMPRIVRHQRTALATWATWELTVMGLAIGFAAVLTRTPVA